jgi:hypothetical protein
LDSEASFEILPVWKSVSPGLVTELLGFWARNQAIAQAETAALRARQAVCIARDRRGQLCGVGTALLRVLPRLRQPMYYYRQFFAEPFRGQQQAIPFFNQARVLLQAHNASLEKPESLGVLLELESKLLMTRAARAYEPAADSTFIGYSPRGLQLRVSYFDDAQLLPPAPLRNRADTRRGNASLGA